MSENSNSCCSSTQPKTHFQPSAPKGPKKSTIDFIKTFARVYYANPTVEMMGMALN